jgi:hypothetical protein
MTQSGHERLGIAAVQTDPCHPAKALGLELPEKLLSIADKVIE